MLEEGLLASVRERDDDDGTDDPGHEMVKVDVAGFSRDLDPSEPHNTLPIDTRPGTSKSASNVAEDV